MKLYYIQSFNCRSAYDRPDYSALQKRSYRCGLSERVQIARRLILDNHTDCRIFDNCLEMGDGIQVVIRLAELAQRGDEPLKQKLTTMIGKDNVPWIDYPQHFAPLLLA